MSSIHEPVTSDEHDATDSETVPKDPSERTQKTDDTAVSDTRLENRDLRVELEIERGGPCLMDDIEGDIVGVDIRFEDGCCRTDLDVREAKGTSKKQFTAAVCSYCPGVVFSRYGCIPRYLQVRRGSFVMETFVPNTETVASLVADLRERCHSVSVCAITSTEYEDTPECCSVDLSALTPKQREAVTWAKRYGYYDPAQEADLEEIADQMDISRSALCQRLKRAESNVFRQLCCDRD